MHLQSSNMDQHRKKQKYQAICTTQKSTDIQIEIFAEERSEKPTDKTGS